MPRLDYVSKLPKPEEIPRGEILVHNEVYPVPRYIGFSGSRFYLANRGDAKDEPCDCGFAPELGTHYRNKKAHRLIAKSHAYYRVMKK